MPRSQFPLSRNARKHFIRTRLWLPFCERQKHRLHSGSSRPSRPLRYLTFCAEDAIDVLLLEQEGIVRSLGGRYPDVTFAALHSDDVDETLRTIPGARGFAGDFFETVLFDPSAPVASPPAQTDDDAFFEDLARAPDTMSGRTGLNVGDQSRELAAQFPFDVINLDLCGYTFRNRENIPGRTILGLRRILEWQRQEFLEQGNKTAVDNFSLLYTTRIDVDARMRRDYERLLDGGIDANARAYSDVSAALQGRAGVGSAAKFRTVNRADYLRLAISKQLATTIADEGWEIDPDHGIPALEVERRKAGGGVYGMLHLAMHLRRIDMQRKARRLWVPRQPDSPYHVAIRALFSNRVEVVPRNPPAEIQQSLQRLVAIGERRRQSG